MSRWMRWRRRLRTSSRSRKRSFPLAVNAIQFWPTGFPVGFFLHRSRQILPQAGVGPSVSKLASDRNIF